ncbi:MAG: cysteine-rich CWC family protein [Bacteroidota bacterium]
MSLHEQKYCPRCNNAFECKVGNVHECQCSTIKFTEEEKAFVEEKYNDCLCCNCLLELKQSYAFYKEKFFFNSGR